MKPERTRAWIATARRTVAQHGGVFVLLRRVSQILATEGTAGLRRRYSRLASRDGAAPAESAAEPAPETQPTAAPDRPPFVSSAGSKCHDDEKGALLVGHPYLISGRGEDLRTSSMALQRAGVPFRIRNCFDGGASDRVKHPGFPLFDQVDPEARHNANLFFLNADEMAHAYRHLGHELFAGRYNIGYWAWELAHFPTAWRGALDYVDELWAPSRFIQQALSEVAACPVIRMPLCVAPAAPAGLSKQAFGLPRDRFVFLFFFDFSSYMSRKNPEAVLQAFTTAFPRGDKTPVTLAIKLNGSRLRPDDYQRFLALPELADPRILILDRVLDDREIRGLVQAADCFVSLHRAEGFGRGPAEAMSLGTPTIVTGYSGNLDFSNESNACVVDCTLVPIAPGAYPHAAGQLWAEPDIEQAAWYMRRLAAESGYGTRLARAAAELIHAQHGLDATGRRYRSRLRTLGLL